jgi:hypothetical protein
MAGVSLRRVHETEKELQACVIFSARDHVGKKKPNDQEHDDNQGDGRKGHCVHNGNSQPSVDPED